MSMTTARAEQVDREAKGVMLAAKTVIIKVSPEDGPLWSVPASVPNQRYMVDLNQQTCTCQDYRNRLLKCKHLFAAEYAAKRIADQGTPCPCCNGTGFVQ